MASRLMRKGMIQKRQKSLTRMQTSRERFGHCAGHSTRLRSGEASGAWRAQAQSLSMIVNIFFAHAPALDRTAHLSTGQLPALSTVSAGLRPHWGALSTDSVCPLGAVLVLKVPALPPYLSAQYRTV